MVLWFLDECLSHYTTLAFCCHPKHVSFARVTLTSFFLKEFVMHLFWADLHTFILEGECWKDVRNFKGRVSLYPPPHFFKPSFFICLSPFIPFLSHLIFHHPVVNSLPPPLLSAHATLCLVYCDVTEKPKTFHVWQYTSRDIF